MWKKVVIWVWAIENTNLYILPSSQHELIAISNEFTDAQAHKEMVCNVNNSQVKAKSHLSYYIYKYSRQIDTKDIVT